MMKTFILMMAITSLVLSASPTVGGTAQEQYLYAHNYWRKQVREGKFVQTMNVPPTAPASDYTWKAGTIPDLTWSTTLAAYAQAWVDKCQWWHSDGPYGENLAFTTATSSAYNRAVDSWVSEGYDNAAIKPTAAALDTGSLTSAMVGHFTQVIWAASTQVGCARKSCATYYQQGNPTPISQPILLESCNYNPPGNYEWNSNDYAIGSPPCWGVPQYCVIYKTV